MVEPMKKWITALLVCAAGIAAAETFATWAEDSSNYEPYPGMKLKEDYFPCVLFDQNQFNEHGASQFYKMWHQGDRQIDVSFSFDGIHWTSSSMTNIKMPAFHPCVVYSDDGFPGKKKIHYRMWFWSGETSGDAIQFTESADGTYWTTPVSIHQDSERPLWTGVSGGWFFDTYGPSSVIYNPNGADTPGDPYSFHYVMLYDTSTEGKGPGASIEQVGLAYSADGLNWKRFGIEPIFIPSGNGADWDGSHHFGAKVIKMKQYHMFYSGSNNQIDSATTLPYAHGIGHAVSADGIHWTADSSNPVFIYSNGVDWRNAKTYTPSVIYDAFIDATNADPYLNLLKMWFTGGTGIKAGIDQAIGAALLPYPQVPYTAQIESGAVRLNWSLDSLSSFADDIDQILIYRMQDTERVLIGQVPKTTTAFDDAGRTEIPNYQIIPVFFKK
jgi:hypothetical protein